MCHWKLPRVRQAGGNQLKLGGRGQETRHLAFSPLSEPCYIFLPNLLKRGRILPKYGQERGRGLI